MELVDLWVILAIPFFWLCFLLGRKTKLNLSYTLALILILVGSFTSTIYAANPSKGLIVILKEVYLFVWFVTVTIVLCDVNKRDFRRIMFVWASVVVLHGILIISQFIWPEIWRITTKFAGQTAAYAHFRPSGLFISEKAGDANKAAFFQLLGFVPLMLAGTPRRITLLLATVLVSSILVTGSMGTTGALMAGLIVSVISLLIFEKNLILLKELFKKAVVAFVFLTGLFLIVVSHNQEYKEHFTKIIAGRAEKSSGGRFDLWQRGIDAFFHQNAFFWGVGPENFREIDPAGNDNQLHNDFLAFTVERGLIAAAGLALIALVAMSNAVHLLHMHNRYPNEIDLFVVVFPAIITSMLLVSLTHQIFHAREMWLILAVQEAMIFKAEEKSAWRQSYQFELKTEPDSHFNKKDSVHV
jgi:O-antigen ligase